MMMEPKYFTGFMCVLQPSELCGQCGVVLYLGRDANNGMYPIAWAVVDVEDEDNWTWFLQMLKLDFNLQDGQNYTLISDRQKVWTAYSFQLF